MFIFVFVQKSFLSSQESVPASFNDDPPFRGFLKKLTGKNSGLCRWTKKWFVLERQNGTLCYYRRKSEETQEGEMGKSIDLQVRMQRVDNSEPVIP